ncbi:GDP-mannose mannosyl hydrolase [Cupriavidus sp. P-10]|uniref:GDP-mannose mannosyl hydrolase n=1 Tax=Cupriavidus sp. P-10 TaxID=2027911 RepID=UPI000E2EE3CD|nr:GDP-mannose mannosyl hydrolase [Cupriavidus sp. P-10]BDB25635.1 GDP-mannose mannosyl hydrolase [Cupriavidus sp. P-10]
MLNQDDFLSVVRTAPLVAIDLVVAEPGGRILLGRRRNRPAQDTWFVPGGRIRKDERLDDAFRRVAVDELGLDMPRAAARLLGAFEHFYPDNFAGAPGIGTHYVVLAYALQVPGMALAAPPDQHSEYRWMTPAQILADEAVHDNARAYFR